MTLVLIETLWNVNTFRRSISASRRSINRNIMECKWVSPWRTWPSWERINRNIMECKFQKTIIKSWNQMRINRNIMECKWWWVYFLPVPYRSINRNIMECKYQSQQKSETPHPVLIETLWNVNPIAASAAFRSSSY